MELKFKKKNNWKEKIPVKERGGMGWENTKIWEFWFWSLMTWVSNPAPLFSSYMSLGKVARLQKPLCPRLWDGDDDSVYLMSIRWNNPCWHRVDSEQIIAIMNLIWRSRQYLVWRARVHISPSGVHLGSQSQGLRASFGEWGRKSQ